MINKSSQTANRQLVLVVQGIGDQEPGASVADFVHERVRHSGVDFDEIEEIHHLLEEPGNHRDTATKFPSHVWRLRQDSSEAIFAEVFWADVSAVRSGPVGVFQGLLQLIFGLHHVAGHAAWAGVTDNETSSVNEQTPRLRKLLLWAKGCLSWPARALTHLARWVALTLRGPVAAITLMLVMTLAAMAVLRWRQVENLDALVLALLGVLGFVGGSVYLWLKRDGPVRRSVALWLLILGPFIVLLSVIPSLLIDGTLVGTSFESWNQVIQYRIHGKAGEIPIYGGGWYALALGDLLVVFLALVPLLLLLMAAVWVLAMLIADSRQRPALAISYVGTALSAGLFFLAFPTVAVVARETFSDWMQFEKALPLTVPLLAVWGAAFLVMMAVAFTLTLRWNWFRRNPDYDKWVGRQTKYGHNSRPRPLIVGGAISSMLVFLAVAGSLLYLGAVFSVVSLMLGITPVADLEAAAKLSTDMPNNVKVILRLFERFDNWIVIGISAVGTVGLGSLMLKHLRTALDIALDVVNHFRWEWTQEPGGRRQRKPVRKNRVRSRMRSVLQAMTDRFEPDCLVIVAHSQGTITAIDVLGEKSTSDLLANYHHKVLVTMGSPFSHLYQHYFPHEYGLLDEGKYETMLGNLDRWLNLFRIDDFVGTHINWKGRNFDVPQLATDWPGELPENRPIGRGGHMNYWRDPEVHKALDDVLTIKPRAL